MAKSGSTERTVFEGPRRFQSPLKTPPDMHCVLVERADEVAVRSYMASGYVEIKPEEGDPTDTKQLIMLGVPKKEWDNWKAGHDAEIKKALYGDKKFEMGEVGVEGVSTTERGDAISIEKFGKSLPSDEKADPPE